ncbi:MAG: InlB B-repeat-containing protein [Mollicutes bacterium]|nr:InlB B-repeat-containing protein [Mollicutes bacterium]
MNKKMIGIIAAVVVVVIVALLFIFSGNKYYEVRFDSVGGTTIETQKVAKNELIYKRVDPQKDGCTFLGWYLDGELFDFRTPITRDITLVARWLE